MDTHRKILIDFSMSSENFTLFKFTGKKMYLGINLAHFHTLVKNIKKKDVLQLYIDDENPTKLVIKVIPKENNRVTTSQITIQSVQELAIDLPTGYGKPIIVSSSEFSKMLKDIGNIGSKTKITSNNLFIRFKCETGGILERAIEFGEISSDDEEVTPVTYDQDFVTDQLCRITKIAGLSSQIKIFPGKPILFKTNIGNLGEISIYLKSKEQIESENHNLINDYESD